MRHDIESFCFFLEYLSASPVHNVTASDGFLSMRAVMSTGFCASWGWLEPLYTCSAVEQPESVGERVWKRISVRACLCIYN
jgi:hypothetical protein